jgi:hypothetical protein
MTISLSSVIVWVLQLALIIHVLKTGRNRFWILILVFMPLIGGLAYLVIELLPEFSGSITGQRAARQVRRTLNPGAELRHHEAAWQQSPNVDNSRRYAEALLEAGRAPEAQDVIGKALTGMFATEPTLLLLRAKIEFADGSAAQAIATLEDLQQHNPDFRSAEGHLLYARALEAETRVDEAIREYSSVSGYYPGVEARYRLALCLKANGNEAAADKEFKSILNDATLAPPHFRKSQKPWLDAVRKEAG